MAERAAQGKKSVLVYSFGLFRLDPARLELSRGDVRLKLQEQPMRLLIRLLASAGEIVTRDDLYRELWPADTFVAFDAGLSTAVKKIRQVLGDTASNPRFVETIPRRGYRFIAPVQMEFPSPKAADGEPQPASLNAVAAAAPARPRPIRKWLFPAIAVLMAAAAWLVSPMVQRNATHGDEGTLLRVTPLTSNAGNEEHPAVSPDGTQVAYVWDGVANSKADIYVAAVRGGDVQRLTFDAAGSDFPCWSPDGAWIAYVRHQRDIMVVAARGGAARKLGEELGFSVTWTPDGSALLYGDRQSNAEASALWSLSVKTGEKRQMAAPVAAIYSFIPFGFSPDGRTFVFARRPNDKSQFALFAAPAEGGQAPRAVSSSLPIHGWAWLSDRDIVVSTYLSGRWGLARLRVDEPDAKLVALAGAGENGTFPAVARRPASGREAGKLILAYQRNQTILNLYSMTAPNGEASRMLSSSSRNGSPQLSPDGKSMVFVSNRGGPEELWQAASDGSHPVAITTFGASDKPPGSPKWAPDSREIVFDVAGVGHHRVYALSLDGGPPRLVVNWDCETVRPNWSRDGKWIYFGANLTGRYEIWKVPSRQTNVPPSEAVQVTQDGGWEAAESVDGGRIFFIRNRYANELWEMAAAGGSAVKLLDGVSHGWWSVSQAGIYYADLQGAQRTIYLYRLATRRTEAVGSIARRVDPATPDFCASLDGRRVIFGQTDFSGSNIMVVEGMR
jgi:Tol biopolymer transport system component/DNA-binding winged helix-turn-helix (wHTH) protein